MVSINVDNVELVYRLRRKLSLAPTIFTQPKTPAHIHRLGNITALKGVSFTLEAGDRLGLLGANGSGKTTLLKLLYGVYEPTAGTITIDGRTDALFNINLGFRREASGRRNILLRGLINGWGKDEIEERTQRIIEFSELNEFIDMPFKSYSQGMAARLAFSVATSFDPEILLMDEWIGAGDSAFQEKAKRKMIELTEKAGIIVLASHNMALIKKTCTKIMQLEQGRVKRFATTDQFFRESDCGK